MGKYKKSTLSLRHFKLGHAVWDLTKKYLVYSQAAVLKCPNLANKLNHKIWFCRTQTTISYFKIAQTKYHIFALCP